MASKKKFKVTFLRNFPSIFCCSTSILRQTRASPSCDENSHKSHQNQSIQCLKCTETCYKINLQKKKRHVQSCKMELTFQTLKKSTFLQSFLEVSIIFSTFFVAPKRLESKKTQISALAASVPVRSARLSRRNTWQPAGHIFSIFREPPRFRQPVESAKWYKWYKGLIWGFDATEGDYLPQRSCPSTVRVGCFLIDLHYQAAS